MDEQHEEIHGVEIRDRCVETSGKRPRQGHQPITAGTDISKAPDVRRSGRLTSS